MEFSKVDYARGPRRPVRVSLGNEVRGASFPQPDGRYYLNAASGVSARVGRNLPGRVAQMAERFRVFTSSWIKKNLKPLSADTDVSFSTWLENTHYSQKKKKSLQKLYDSTIALGEDDYKPFNNFCKCFIKDEAYSSYKHPRGIYARKDEFKLRVGPIFKAIENELSKLKYFIKKIPVNQRSRFIFDRFGNVPSTTGTIHDETRRCISTDYTAYESSFTREVMNDCEMLLYEYMVQLLPEGKNFMRLIRHVLQGKNECRFANITIKLMAGRMSGEMNTSLGNGFTNLMLYLFAMEEFGCREFDCLVEGDDGIGTYIGTIIPDSFYQQLGFNIKLIYHKTLNTASFCGQIFDFESSTVITDPIKVILNFAWVNIKYHKMTDKVRKGLLRAKAMSLLYQYPGCPILQVFGMRVLKNTVGVKPIVDTTLDPYKRGIVETAIHEGCPVRPVVMTTRLLMQDVFNVSIVDQLILESYLDTLRDMEPIQHPVLYNHVPNVCFDYDKVYTSDRYGPDIVPFQGLGALRNSLVSLVNVLENQS